MTTRLISLLTAVAVTVSLCRPSAAQAATPAIQITRAYYNSPGSDTGSNTSLNAEYVRLTNQRSYVINLKNWTVRDKTGYTYRFASDLRVAAGNSVIIHTGKGTNTGTHRYWGRSTYVWNNTGDTAYLRNAVGTLVDSCTWSSGIGYTSC